MAEEILKYLNKDSMKNTIKWKENDTVYIAGNESKIMHICNAYADEYVVLYKNLNYKIINNYYYIFDNYEEYSNEEVNNFFSILSNEVDYSSNIRIQSLFIAKVRLSIDQILLNKDKINWYPIIKCYPQYYNYFIDLICNIAKNTDVKKYNIIKTASFEINKKYIDIDILSNIIDAFIIHHSHISEPYFYIFLEKYISFLSRNQVLHIIKKMELNDKVIYSILENFKVENIIDILLNFQYDNMSVKLKDELNILQKLYR